MTTAPDEKRRKPGKPFPYTRARMCNFRGYRWCVFHMSWRRTGQKVSQFSQVSPSQARSKRLATDGIGHDHRQSAAPRTAAHPALPETFAPEPGLRASLVALRSSEGIQNDRVWPKADGPLSSA
jgi:hypothetical protein